MGQTISIQCKTCNEREGQLLSVSPVSSIWVIQLGIGMSFSPERVFQGYPPDEKPLLLSVLRSPHMKKKVQSMLAAASFPGRDYGYYLYGCEHCGSLSSRFWFTLYLGEEIYEPPYACPTCKKPLQRLEIGDQANPATFVRHDGHIFLPTCPVCKGQDFMMEEMILWD